MHTLSKVLLGFAAVAAIVAMFLTSMLYDTRNEWLKRVSERQDKIEVQKEDVRKKSLVVSDLENEVNRRMANWGRSWEIPAQQVNMLDADSGTIALGVGTNQGLATQDAVAIQAGQQRTLPTVYVFGKAPNGTTQEPTVSYLGEFRITEAQPDQVAAQLTRKPLPGEVQRWGELASDGVRVWSNIPSNWTALNAKYQAQIADWRQDVQDEEGRVATLDVLITKSRENLDRRMAELEGNETPVEGASQDVIDGLVHSLQIEESARNQQLLILNQLRHEYDSKYNELIDLLQRNRNLEKQLPQSSAGGSTSPIQPTVGRSVEASVPR